MDTEKLMVKKMYRQGETLGSTNSVEGITDEKNLVKEKKSQQERLL